MPFSAEDSELLQGALLQIHEPRELEELARLAPLVIKRVIPAGYVLRLEFAPGSNGGLDQLAAMWEHPARATRAQLRKAMQFAPEHPFTEYLLRTGDFRPLRLSDFWTRREQLASKIHREVYRHLGIGWMLTVPLVRIGRAGAITLGRAFDDDDFSERDREMLRWLAPHLMLATSAAERASARRDAETAAFAGLGLTPREREVAKWLARGRTNGEIAAILSMRPRTVEKHVERILPKLGVENRTSATRVILGLASVGAGSSALDPGRALEAMRQTLRPASARARR